MARVLDNVTVGPGIRRGVDVVHMDDHEHNA